MPTRRRSAIALPNAARRCCRRSPRGSRSPRATSNGSGCGPCVTASWRPIRSGCAGPGGLERLAAVDPRVRQQAGRRIGPARLAAADQPLLVELFSDNDPLVREFSLRGLQNIGGGQATAALTRLLADPEPNVRAAVLKQLEEKPDPSIIPKLAEYLKTEKDPDLLVHAIRFLPCGGRAGGHRGLDSHAPPRKLAGPR